MKVMTKEPWDYADKLLITFCKPRMSRSTPEILTKALASVP